jgi:hypothetical protein
MTALVLFFLATVAGAMLATRGFTLPYYTE